MTFVKAKSEALQLTFVIMYCFKNKYKAKSEALQLTFVKAKIESLELTFVKAKSESLQLTFVIIYYFKHKYKTKSDQEFEMLFCNYVLLQTQVQS